MFRSVTLPAAAILSLAFAAPALGQQQDAELNQQLRVFLECGPCDFDFVRTEIVYVDWMRDRADADVHVIARAQPTGGGGREHTLDFIGLRRHAGKADTLSYLAERDETQDVTRRGLARVLKLGLVRYLVDTPVALQMNITVPQSSAGESTPTNTAQARDPWDAWVFSIGGNANSNGESTQKFTNVNTNFGANRVTAAWKINIGLNGSYGRQSFRYALSDDRGDTTVISLRRSYSANTMIVKSVNGKTSVGARLNASKSTFGNTELSVSVEPAVEYNVFPYTESTRRQLLISYSAGVRSQSYREETIYSQTKETRPLHGLETSYATRQTWGNLSFGVAGSQYLHDTSLFNLNFFTGTSINIARGLRLNLNGNYSMVRDQLNIAKRDLTPEEVLLRQRQLATSYRYFASFGFSYRFGSAVQNVVNPRFGGPGGEFFFFF
jgi:hypothetical protein